MADNKTKPTTISVDTYLATINESRRSEARAIIEIMGSISGFEPIMWGPSIIGFDQYHYVYESGREGDASVG